MLVASAPVLLEWASGLEHTASDIARYFLPNLDWRWQHAGAPAAWNPWVFGGYPMGADPQVAGLHPFDWLYRWIPLRLAAVIEGAICPVAAAVGMRLYLRQIGCSRAAALLGAAAFALGGFMGSRGPHLGLRRAAAAIPWGLLVVERFSAARRVVLMALVLWAILVAGHPQGSLLAVFLVSVYGLSFGQGGLWARMTAVSSACILAGALSAPLWLPAAELLLESTRALGSNPFPNPVVGIRDLYRLIVPLAAGGGGALSGTVAPSILCSAVECGVYPGMVAVVGAIAAVPLAIRFGRVGFWVAVALVSLVLATGVLEALLGTLRVRGSTRFLMWWSVAVSVLAGSGFDRLRAKEQGARALIAAIFAGLAVILVWHLFVRRGVFSVTAAAGVTLIASCAALLLVVGASERARPRAIGLVIVLLVADLLFTNHDLSLTGVRRGTVDDLQTSLAPIARIAKQSDRSRVLVLPMTFAANWAPNLGLRLVQGYNPLVPAPTALVLDQQYGIGLDGVGAVTEPGLAGVDDHALDLLRVGLVAVRSGVYSEVGEAIAESAREPDARWERLPDLVDGVVLYRNRRSRPAAWFVDGVRVVGSQEIYDAIHGRIAEGTFDPRHEVLSTQEIGPTAFADQSCSRGRVDVVGYGSDEIILDVGTDCARFLATSEWNYPGWGAWVDGRAVEVHTVNGGFRAVLVPAGSRRVVFRFEPTWTTFARVLAFAAALALLAMVGTIRARILPNRPLSAPSSMEQPVSSGSLESPESAAVKELPK